MYVQKCIFDFFFLSLYCLLYLMGLSNTQNSGSTMSQEWVCIVNWMRFEIRKRKLCRSPDCSLICTAIAPLEEFLKAAIGSNGNQFVFQKDCYSVTGDSNCKRAYGRAASSRSPKDPETSIGISTLPTRGQFHQCSMSSFYACRSHKVQKAA